jgi:hypothetical protein
MTPWRPPTRRLAASACLVLALLATPGSGLAAQPLDLDTPADSPAWWTLTDAVSPAQLRAAYRDREASLERYLKALDAGLAPGMGEEGAKRLRFYLNPALTPELEPMWLALDVLSREWLPRVGEQEVARGLARYGISERGRRTLFDALEEWRGAVEKRIAAIGPLQVRFVKLQWALHERLGKESVEAASLQRAIAAGDPETFGSLTGTTTEEARELMAAAKVDPGAETAETALPRLKALLSEEDWSGFGLFLLKEVASRFGPFAEFD